MNEFDNPWAKPLWKRNAEDNMSLRQEIEKNYDAFANPPKVSADFGTSIQAPFQPKRSNNNISSSAISGFENPWKEEVFQQKGTNQWNNLTPQSETSLFGTYTQNSNSQAFAKMAKDSETSNDVLSKDYYHRNQYVNKNKGEIIPYTRMDTTNSYSLADTKPANWKEVDLSPTPKGLNSVLKYVGLKKLKKPQYNAGDKDLTRNLWEKENNQCLQPYDNYLKQDERINRLKNGQNLFLDIEYNPNADYKIPSYRTSDTQGKTYVNKYDDVIEKYAQEYNLDSDLARAIMYNEAATGHWAGLNARRDKSKLSKSQMPMNIRGDKWGDFEGKHYDTYQPEENINLGVQVLKKLQNSIHNPTPEKIGTLWNSTGAMEVNDYGARTKTIYDKKPWKLKDF